MIIHVNQFKFTNIFLGGEFDLPIDRGSISFNDFLKRHLNEYVHKCRLVLNDNEAIKFLEIICEKLNKTIDYYYCGLPLKSATEFAEIMDKLEEYPLTKYQKHKHGPVLYLDKLELFRIRKLNKDENRHEFLRKDIFHIPYSKRESAKNCRYSIPGFPCLYLGTNLELCYRELELCDKDEFIVSKFMLKREYDDTDKEIYVYDLARKPKQFMMSKNEYMSLSNDKNVSQTSSQETNVDTELNREMLRYLFWYPIICSVSFVNLNRHNQFSSEYIIPQLFLQWLRIKNEKNMDKLIGIRYFSCRNRKINVNGYNYVFPTSGIGHRTNQDFCMNLSQCFKLTNPKLCINKSFKELEPIMKSLQYKQTDELFNE